MTSKLFTNLQKVATIAACAREALTIIDSEALDTGFSYIVTPQDVESAWEIMGLSMNTYKKFKVCFIHCLTNSNDFISACH